MEENMNPAPNKKNNGMKIFIIILVIVMLGTIGYLLYNKFNNEARIEKYQNEITDLKKELRELQKTKEIKNEISLEDLYGTYTWEKIFTNNTGTELNLKIKLVLNNDGSATYEASSGLEAEITKGTFVYENGKIIYNKESYDNGNAYTNENTKTETFKVVDENTLQNNYYNQLTALKKE